MIALLVALLGGVAQAQDCGEPCAADADCARVQASCQLDAGAPKSAVKTLKAAYAAHPEEADLVQRLALAYLETGNTVWATRRLLEHIEAYPDDIESRTWATWVVLDAGDLARADTLLPQMLHPAASPVEARAALLRALLHHYREEPTEAAALLTQVRTEADTLYPEDVAFQRSLRRQILGDPGNPLSTRLWFTTGWSTNATETSPQAEGGEGGVGSALSALDAVGRLEPWSSPMIRPRGEVRLKTQIPWSTPDYSYADVSTRLGVELGPADKTRGRLLYSGELFGDKSGDAYSVVEARLFMEAHRLDVEVDLGPSAQVFAGGGRRIYRRLDRTRTELDAGVALVQGLPLGLNLTGLLTGRRQWARHPDWNLIGGTALVRFAAVLPADVLLKVRAMGLRDVYPDHALARRDWTVRVQAGPWTPSLGGWRLGLTYAFNQRWSDGDWGAAADPYSYSRPDHRVLLEARWEIAADPWAAPSALPPAHHVVPPYGVVEAGDSGLDRVQDLLRQEDSARRGSSCAD